MLDEWLTDLGDNVAVRVTKAMADISVGRQSEAIYHYEKILETAPEHIIALNNLAWIFDENGDERAIGFARRAYEAAPSRAEIADTYGWIMLCEGNTEQSVELLSTALAGAPENSDIRYHFASALSGNWKRCYLNRRVSRFEPRQLLCSTNYADGASIRFLVSFKRLTLRKGSISEAAILGQQRGCFGPVLLSMSHSHW